MKIGQLISCAAAIVCLAPGIGASSRPDFSGTWVMDKDRSFSNPPGLEQTLVVAQKGNAVKVEAKLVTARGEQVINETYTLDGKETEFAPPGAQPESKGKRTANWLPDGRGFVVNDTVTSPSPKGPVVQQTTRKWTLSTDGATLTIDYYFDNQRGSFEAKRVFAKK